MLFIDGDLAPLPPPHPAKRATHTRSTMLTYQTGAAEVNFPGKSETAFVYWLTMGLFFSVILIGLVGSNEFQCVCFEPFERSTLTTILPRLK